MTEMLANTKLVVLISIRVCSLVPHHEPAQTGVLAQGLLPIEGILPQDLILLGGLLLILLIIAYVLLYLGQFLLDLFEIHLFAVQGELSNKPSERYAPDFDEIRVVLSHYNYLLVVLW